MKNNAKHETDIVRRKHRSWKYDILHEVCHLIIGYSCCKEHMEFEVHGATTLLCKLLQIDIGNADERMECYAGCSSHNARGRIDSQQTRTDKPTKKEFGYK